MTYIEHFLRTGFVWPRKKKTERRQDTLGKNVFWYVVGRAKDVQGMNTTMHSLYSG